MAGYAYFGTDHTHPAKIYKIGLGAGSAPPTEIGYLQLKAGTCGTACYPPDGGNIGGADADTYGEIYLQSSLIDLAKGYAYFGTDTVPGQVVKVAISQQGAIKGTKVNVAETANVNDVRFYSHAAAGNVRLAIYDNASPKNLLWQSGSMANAVAGGWLAAPIASGSPSSLTLITGTYWLAWQVDNTKDIPSYTAGASGDGFVVEQPYGAFPSPLSGEQSSAERWSLYLSYNSFMANNYLFLPLITK